MPEGNTNLSISGTAAGHRPVQEHTPSEVISRELHEQLESAPTTHRALPLCGMGVPGGIMDTNLRIYYCNKEFGELFGQESDQIVGMRLYDFMSEMFCAGRRQVFEQVVQKGGTHQTFMVVRGNFTRCVATHVQSSELDAELLDNEMAPPDLVACISAPCSEEIYLEEFESPNASVSGHNDFGEFNALSDIERQVLARIVRGFPNKQIAAELYKSIRTIEGYRRRIGDKTGYDSMADLLAAATRAGFRVLPYDKLNVSHRVEPISVPARVGSGVLAS